MSTRRRSIGVAAITAGPGVTDGITGIANAWRANSPILVFGGQGPFENLRRGSLQEMDHIGVVRPITKYADTVYQTHRIPEYIELAVRHAVSGTPGPAYLEIPMDVFMAQVEDDQVQIPRIRTDPPRLSPDREEVRDEYFIKLTWTPTNSLMFSGSYRNSKIDQSGYGVGQFDAGTISNGNDSELEIAVVEGSYVVSDSGLFTFKASDFRNPGSGEPDNILDFQIGEGVPLDVDNLDAARGLLESLRGSVGAVKVGFEICEDAWVGQRPGALEGAGVQFVVRHGRPLPYLGPSAVRSARRAAWRWTREEPAEIPSSWAISACFHPSKSYIRTTDRCRSVSASSASDSRIS